MDGKPATDCLGRILGQRTQRSCISSSTRLLSSESTLSETLTPWHPCSSSAAGAALTSGTRKRLRTAAVVRASRVLSGPMTATAWGS